MTVTEETRTLTQIARENGISREAVRQRRERGAPLDGPSMRQPRNEDWAIAERHGVHVDTIRMRRKRGLPTDGPSRATGPRTCKVCGETGHFAKTCVSAGKVSPCPRSAALAAFFRYAADAVELNDRPDRDPAELFDAAIRTTVAAVNLGTLPAVSALDAEQAQRMIDRHITGRYLTTGDVINILRGLAAEVTP